MSNDNSADNDAIEFMIIDDDDVSIMAIRRAMKKLGLNNPVTVARDGLEALEMLEADVAKASGEATLQPRIVTLDLKMPCMGGLEFLERVRSDPRFRRLVIFVLSTSDAPKDIEAAYEQNIAGYIIKDQAVSTVREALALLRDYTEQVTLPPLDNKPDKDD